MIRYQIERGHSADVWHHEGKPFDSLLECLDELDRVRLAKPGGTFRYVALGDESRPKTRVSSILTPASVAAVVSHQEPVCDPSELLKAASVGIECGKPRVSLQPFTDNPKFADRCRYEPRRGGVVFSIMDGSHVHYQAQVGDLVSPAPAGAIGAVLKAGEWYWVIESISEKL